MSILLMLVALVALVFVGVAVAGVFLVMRGDSSADRERLVQATAARTIEDNAHLALRDLRDILGVLRDPAAPAEQGATLMVPLAGGVF